MPRTVATILLIGALIAGAAHTVFAAPPQEAPAGIANFSLLETPIPLPGNPLRDEAGEAVVLKDRGGKVRLINIWATWCAPCVEELPSLDALQRKLGGDDFAVVAVSMDRGGFDDIRPFLKKTGISHLSVYWDENGAFSRALEVKGLPVTFLVDRGGRIIGKAVGPADWASPAAMDLVRGRIETGKTGR